MEGTTEISLWVCGVCGTYHCDAWRLVDAWGNSLPGYHNPTPRKRRRFVAVESPVAPGETPEADQ